MFDFLFRKKTPPLSQQAREELLAALASALETDKNGYAFGNTLHDYAAKETDAAQFKSVLDRSLQVFTDNTGVASLEPYEIVFAEATIQSQLQNYVAIVDKLFECMLATSQQGKSAAFEDALRYTGFRAMRSEPVRRYVEDNIDRLIGGLDPRHALFAAYRLTGNYMQDKEHSAYKDFLVGKIVDIAEALPVTDHTRHWCLGYIALHQTDRDSAPHRKARALLLQDLSAENDANKIFMIAEATVGDKYMPDKVIDSAVAEKWKKATATMNRDDLFTAAAHVIGDGMNHVIAPGKTLNAALDAAIEAAKSYAADRVYPAQVEYTLKQIVSRKLPGHKAAAALLPDFKAPAVKPTMSVSDFQAAFESKAEKEKKIQDRQKLENDKAETIKKHLDAGLPLETPVETLKPVHPKTRKPAR